MKPQIVTDLAGISSKELQQTVARITRGATWKKQRVIVVLPADMMIPAKVALSHWNLIFPPNNGVARILAQGMEVGDAYSSIIQNILEHPEFRTWEYLLTIEHDNIPPQDGVLKLIERMEDNPQFTCISGLYFTKGEGGVAQIWGDINDPIHNSRPQIPQPDKLIECYGVGMGFALWRLNMFKNERLRKPWFKTVIGKTGGGTQDLYFWADARKYGYRCAVDCAVKVGHYDHQTDTIW